MTRGGETAIDNGEEVLAYVPDETPADVAAEDNIDPSEPAPAAARTAPGHATRRIAVGLIASWAVLVATPGALPWTAEDNAARAIAIAVVVATVVALIGLALAFLADDSLAEDGASFGTAAAAIAMALVALQVVNVLLIPDDAAYRSAVVAIGLLILLAVALVSATGARISSFEGFKFSVAHPHRHPHRRGVGRGLPVRHPVRLRQHRTGDGRPAVDPDDVATDRPPDARLRRRPERCSGRRFSPRSPPASGTTSATPTTRSTSCGAPSRSCRGRRRPGS